jgi:hypothetical protein
LRARLPRTVKRLWRTRQAKGLARATAWTLLLGTLLFWRVEGWSVLDSFYLCVLTFATVGGGDMDPATLVGEVFATLIALAGAGIYWASAMWW